MLFFLLTLCRSGVAREAEREGDKSDLRGARKAGPPRSQESWAPEEGEPGVLEGCRGERQVLEGLWR